MHYRALLFVVLALAVTASRADMYVLNESFAVNNVKFDGDVIDLRIVQLSPEPQPSCNVNASHVVGDGLTIQGSDREYMTSNKLVKVDVLDLHVTDATITLDGYMPHNSTITFAGVTANMQSAKPLFALASLHVHNKSTLTIQGVTAVWATATSDAWVAQLSRTGERTTVQRESGLYLLQVTAQNAAGVLNIDTEATMLVSGNSALTVDYVSCTSCSDAVVAASQAMTVSDTSIFRISNIASDTQPLLRAAVDIAIADKSLFLMSYSEVNNGNLFDMTSGSITLTNSSVLTYRDLRATATGLTAAMPSSVDASSTVYGRSCTIGGAALTSTASYQAAKLNINTYVTPAGYIDGTQTCAYAQCVPTHFSTPTPQQAQCMCVCANSYSQPSCATPYDPLTVFTQQSDGRVICSVSNCVECTSQPSQCSKCADGYNLQADGSCTKPTTTTTTTTTTTRPTPPPGPQPLPPQSCSPHCIFCETACYNCWTPVCRMCEAGYVLQGAAICVKQYNSAHMITAVPAAIGMLLLGAAMGYGL